MGFGDPLEYFKAGQAAGSQSASPFQVGAGNVMDVFKQGIENQMKLAQTAALFKGEKNYENSVDPTKITAQKRLDALPGSGKNDSSGMGPGGGAITPDASTDMADGGSQGGGILGTNVPVKNTNAMGTETVDQRAPVNEKAAQELIGQRTSMMSNANAMDTIAELQKHYEKGMAGAWVHSDPKANPLPQTGNPILNAAKTGMNMASANASSWAQGASLNANKNSNPEWKIFSDLRKNTSFAVDRNLYDEKGKLIGQQLDAGLTGVSGGDDPKTAAYGKFSNLYDMGGRRLEMYNNAVRKTFGAGSKEDQMYEIHPKNEAYIAQTHDRYQGLSMVQSGQQKYDDVNNTFKNHYGQDL